MKQHPNEERESRKRAMTKALYFSVTGKWETEEALTKLQRAFDTLMMAMYSSGRCVLDSPEHHLLWAQSIGLPSSEGFAFVRDCGVKGGWLVKVEVSEGRALRLTEKGVARAEALLNRASSDEEQS